MMKNNKKWALSLTALSTVGLLVMGSLCAKDLSNLDLDKAQSKAQDALNRLTIKPTEALPNAGQNPNIDGLEGVQGRVPVIPVNTALPKATPELVDPMLVADRVKRESDIDPSDFKGSNVLVFVSYSMPEASLKRIALETAKVGGVMVVRGFVNNSLKQTVEASEKLTNLGAQLQIHPVLFSDYDVTQVPSYVLVKSGVSLSGCGKDSVCNGYLKLVGDAPLGSVFERMSRSEDTMLGQLAQANLDKLEAR
jgi:conjugal transfer pilus assembly protein TrbC